MRTLLRWWANVRRNTAIEEMELALTRGDLGPTFLTSTLIHVNYLGRRIDDLS